MTLADGDDSDDPVVGQTFDGRYRVTKRLGVGGMGFVYLAEHAQLGRSMVLKRLRPELLTSDSSRERFLREAQAASKIQHPHVITVSDFGVDATHGAYYVMELLVGTDLGALLGREGALGLERSVHIFGQSAEALAAAHARSIVHRDLKPENIFLIPRDGHPDFVKVLDFGLARLMDANRKLTETGQVIGTPRYMAPEQCRGEKVDARADVYSLALILHEMLTGEQPYRTLSTYEILGKKMFEHVTAPSRMTPPVYLPAPLETFLMRCLEREAPLRPAHAAQMADELHTVCAELGLAPSPFAHLAEGARQSFPVMVPDFGQSLDQPAQPPPLAAAAPEGAAPREPAAPAGGAAPPRASSGLGALLGIASGAVVLGLVIVLGGWLYLSEESPWFERVRGPARADTPTRAAAQAPSAADAPAADPPVVPAPPVPAPPTPALEPPAAPVALVQVVTEPPGAEVHYEGALLGVTPLELGVPRDLPDRSRVEIRLAGHETRTITVLRDVPIAHARLEPLAAHTPEFWER